MPGRPCTPEAGAANDPGNADADGHRHRLRLGGDQPDYVRLLRLFDSFARAALHASVTRRAAHYGFHRQLVSIQSDRRQPKPIPAHVQSFRGRDRPHDSDRELHHERRGRRCRGVHPGCADPRVELAFRRLHAWTLKERSPGSQPVGKTLLCQNVSGRFRTCQSHRKPLPAAGLPGFPRGPSWCCHPACAGRPTGQDLSIATRRRSRMRTLSAKDVKYGFGRLIDLARAAPLTVAKYGRPGAPRRGRHDGEANAVQLATGRAS